MSDADPSQPKAQPSSGPLQAPRGTRDFYPEDFARRKYVFDAWCSASLRHGFDEIDGPTFEHLDLYTRKSGEGIVSELFSFKRFGGETDFALRPEFTPTLARMVAAKANALPKPIKWFSIGNYFRAERPQRGRLREFVQWNCDILGDPSPEADAECIACCVEALQALGLRCDDVQIRVGHRDAIALLLRAAQVSDGNIDRAFVFLDQYDKLSPEQRAAEESRLGLNADAVSLILHGEVFKTIWTTSEDAFSAHWRTIKTVLREDLAKQAIECLRPLGDALKAHGVSDWCVPSLGVVRGLAYYTGAVFEVYSRAARERAIAGGGRYDNLVELFGGPPTPAVGFAMGDVVLSLVLEDKKLLPSGPELRRKIGAAPDVFVISNGAPDSDAQLQPLLAALRRAGLHARRSYKSTKNVGKLRKDAVDAGARTVAIIESATTITLKNLDAQTPEVTVSPAELPGAVARIVRPGV